MFKRLSAAIAAILLLVSPTISSAQTQSQVENAQVMTIFVGDTIVPNQHVSTASAYNISDTGRINHYLIKFGYCGISWARNEEFMILVIDPRTNDFRITPKRYVAEAARQTGSAYATYTKLLQEGKICRLIDLARTHVS